MRLRGEEVQMYGVESANGVALRSIAAESADAPDAQSFVILPASVSTLEGRIYGLYSSEPTS